MTLGPDATTRSLLAAATVLSQKTNRSVSTRGHLREPVFLSPPSFFRCSWWDLFRSSFQRLPRMSAKRSPDLFRQIPLLGRRIVVTPITISLAVHVLAIPLLPFLLRVVPRRSAEDGRLELKQQDIVYYHFKKFDTPSKFPRVLPKGPGGHPGASNAADQVPAPSASRSLGKLFAISHPRVPDNDHQTILQSKSRADLKIKTDVALPNLVVAGPAVPKRPLEFNANQVHPLQPSARSLPSDSSALTKIATAQATNGMLGVTVSQPHLPVPVGGASATVHVTAAKSYGTSGEGPAIEVEQSAGGGDGAASLLVLGLDPAGSPQSVALPPGNRYGDFSASPSGPGSGFPEGGGSSASGGSNGDGDAAGGDVSTGVGNGNHGGGGGRNGTEDFVSVRGSGSESALLADPGPAPVQLVYAIPASMLLRHNRLIVSAGPIGGGGSAAYGVLPCGKIYTVFLATAAKQWSLQYCQKSQTPDSSANRARSTVTHTELPILAPEADARFDFKRFPLPPEKVGKSILIRGILTEEGKPENLEIYQGLLPIMDSAALAAFQQWTFKPAMRSGKAMRVEILLSIPMN